jgi:two-component system, NtrC family, response regulator
VLERAQILAEGNHITPDDLPDAMQAMLTPAEVSSADPLNLAELERRAVRAALEQAKGNKGHAAKALGISRRALYGFIEKYRLEAIKADVEAASG